MFSQTIRIPYFKLDYDLGLIAELAYVRDGNINDVAQHFVVPVPPHIKELCFVWENLDQKVVISTNHVLKM